MSSNTFDAPLNYTNWKELSESPDYRSDTGNKHNSDPFARGEKKLGVGEGCREAVWKSKDGTHHDRITLEHAFELAGRLPGKPMLLVKTSYRGPGAPGAYYAKAFVSEGADWVELKQKLNENNATHLHSTRKAWVCGPGRQWTSLNQ